MGIKHNFVSAKVDGGDATLIKPSNWNENHTIDGEIIIPAVTTPAVPSAGTFALYGHNRGNTRTMPTAVGSGGMNYTLQPAMFTQKIGMWQTGGNTGDAPTTNGLNPFTVVGNSVARPVNTTNLMTRMRRAGYRSLSTAGSLVSLRTAAAQFTTGGGAGLGGFFASYRFNYSDLGAISGVRSFIGMSSATTAPANVEPSTLVNSIGVAQLSTDSTQLYIVYGGSAAQTPIPLGTDFPPYNGAVGITTGVPYDFVIWCDPNSNGVINWQLLRMDTNTVTGGTITPSVVGTETPASTTLLNPVLWRCNNATAIACGFDLTHFYIETDY